MDKLDKSQKIILILCFVAVFVLGLAFGTGVTAFTAARTVYGSSQGTRRHMRNNRQK